MDLFIIRPNRFLRLLVKVWYSFMRLCSDFVYLLEPNKLYIYSWMTYRGLKMLNNNWGDDINKYFIESISHLKVKDVTPSLFYKLLPIKGYSCIGSIIGNFKADNYEVWGSGIIEENHELESSPKKVYSVRGPFTRRELLKNGIHCPEKYGDPALLISRYYRPSFEKIYELGIIPHYTDIDNPTLKSFCNHHPKVHIIKMQGYNDWHDIPQEICSCKKIISSSLHGLIISDSYRVPNAWVRFSDQIIGGKFKYLDYFSSVGRIEMSPHRVNSEEDIESIIINDEFSIAPNDKINYRDIFNACPFKDKLFDYKELIPKLSEYESFVEKGLQYCTNEFVNSESELDKLINHLQPLENSLLFRGVSEAKYKMFASSQRHWLQKTDWVARMGKSNYYDFIEEIIRRAECLDEVQRYMLQHNVQTNDMFLMALMQHFEAPSPMIDFSESLLTGLFFASDWDDSRWNDSGKNMIDDYVSLYYVSKHFDWIDASVQRIMQSSADNIERIMSEAVVKRISLDTVETMENISRLLYRQFRLDGDKSNVSFIPLGGSSLGRINIDIPVLNFHCEYEIINDRIVKQQGMFIMNNTVNEPLAEIMNKQSQQKMFSCANIHKKLLPYLWEKYLHPNNLKHDVVYENGKLEVTTLLEAIKKLS